MSEEILDPIAFYLSHHFDFMCTQQLLTFFGGGRRSTRRTEDLSEYDSCQCVWNMMVWMKCNIIRLWDMMIQLLMIMRLPPSPFHLLILTKGIDKNPRDLFAYLHWNIEEFSEYDSCQYVWNMMVWMKCNIIRQWDIIIYLGQVQMKK